MTEQFRVNTECSLRIIHFLIALRFPHLSVQATDCCAVLHKDVTKHFQRFFQMIAMIG